MSRHTPRINLTAVLGFTAAIAVASGAIVAQASLVHDANAPQPLSLLHSLWHVALLVSATGLSWLTGYWLLRGWRTDMELIRADKSLMEDALRRHQQMLDTIIEHLPLGLFVKNVKDDYRWTHCNRKAEELFGFKAAEVIGTTDYDHFPLYEANFYREANERLMQERKVIEVEGERVTGPQGVWLAHSIKVPIYDAHGEPSLLLGIFQDITIKKQQADAELQRHAQELEAQNALLEQARANAEKADVAKTHFLATMSHEIRTPLNGVIGTADLMSRTPLSGLQKDYVRTIQNSAETLLRVISDILDLTKLEAGHFELETIPFDVSLTLEDVMDIHSANASKKNLDLLLRYAPGTPDRILGDPGRVQQILNNLISNAIKFTHQGHILIDVESSDEVLEEGYVTLKVAVHDTGIGISEKNLGKIFEHFMQEEASTTRHYGGAGLGLSICKQLVELMGGQIGVTSSKGRGSTFWFTLPSKLDLQPDRPIATATLLGRKVMIVDDNCTNIEILTEQLAYWGCTALAFKDGGEALAWIEQTQEAPDLAILDHNMPTMSGSELGQNLKLHPLTAAMPLIIFSSRGVRGDAAYFEELGFDGYLVKPSRPQDLRCMIAALLSQEKPSRILTRHIFKDSETEREGSDAPDSLNLHILVVEDDVVNQKVVRMMLEEFGCHVHVASSGYTGIAAFQQAIGDSKFDLVFMDMQMPDMDGSEATRIMRQWEIERHVIRTPIVALTANALSSHRQECLDAGMDDYMTKPITRDKLFKQFSRWGFITQPPIFQSGTEDDVLSGLSADKVATLRHTFVESSLECLGEFEKAALFDDTETFRRVAHRLKGAAKIFGHNDLYSLCADFEIRADSVDKDEAVSLIEQALEGLGIRAEHTDQSMVPPAGIEPAFRT